MYIRQSRLGPTSRATATRLSTGVTSTQLSERKYERVVSFRSSQLGDIVPDTVMDPYGMFTSGVTSRKRSALGLVDPGTRVDDNGHAFLSEKWTCSSSYGGTPRVIYDYPSTAAAFRYSATGFTAAGAQVASPLVATMPFRFAQNGTGVLPGDDSRTPRNYFSSIILAPTTSLIGRSIDQAGQFAIAKRAPGRPEVDVFRSAAELVTQLPRLPGFSTVKSSLGTTRSTKRFWTELGSNTADEFLNWLFGVAPTFADIIAIGEVLQNSTSLLLQLQRDNGKPIRRSMVFAEKSDTKYYQDPDLVSGTAYINCSAFGYNTRNVSGGTGRPTVARGTALRTTLMLHRVERNRFSGSFTYFIPSLAGLTDRFPTYVEQLSLLYNTVPTKQNSWELLPFSWLIDWFADVKSALDMIEVSEDDATLLNYGYMQRETICIARQTSKVVSGSSTGMEVASQVRYNRKERRRANPYGFVGFGSPGLDSPMKLAILAALGLSRTPILN